MTYAELKEAYNIVCGIKRRQQERIDALEAQLRQVHRIPPLCLSSSNAVCVLAVSSEKARQRAPCQKLLSPSLPGPAAHFCPTSPLPMALPC